MDTSFIISPIKSVDVQRKLSFNNDDYLDEEILPKCCNEFESPPYKRLKTLTMFETSTPSTGRTTPPFKNHSLASLVTMTPQVYPKLDRIELSPTALANGISRLNNSVPINPFTPSGRLIMSESRKRKKDQRNEYKNRLHRFDNSFFEDTQKGDNVQPDYITLNNARSLTGPNVTELEISRFSEEFRIDSYIASGSFGVVFKCINYLDGMEYAIKKSAKPIAGTNRERLARREVFAHAALRSHLHIVTYYSSWIESGHLYIQTEFCNGGSLDNLISENEKNRVFTESRIYRLMNHVSKGLKFMHSQNLAHMDIKPANILFIRIQKFDSSDDDIEYYDDDEDRNILYKIGDLGHVVVVDDPVDIEDGDCRYMSAELLNENYQNLKKADIFSFGLTLLEVAGNMPLPQHGDEWQNLRNGRIPYLEKYSSTFNNTLKGMLHPDPEKRPNIGDILKESRATNVYLRTEINNYKMKRDLLFAQHAHSSEKCLKSIPFNALVDNSPRDIIIPKIVVDNNS